jgi:hypothetical protein
MKVEMMIEKKATPINIIPTPIILSIFVTG